MVVHKQRANGHGVIRKIHPPDATDTVEMDALNLNYTAIDRTQPRDMEGWSVTCLIAEYFAYRTHCGTFVEN